jgi:hypothetical protein
MSVIKQVTALFIDADLDALLRLQQEIRTRLSSNGDFFSNRIISFKAQSTQNMLSDLQTHIKLETGKYCQAQESLAHISNRVQARANRIFELAEEKRVILKSITKLKQLHMISMHANTRISTPFTFHLLGSGLGLIESHRRGKRYREIANIFMVNDRCWLSL